VNRGRRPPPAGDCLQDRFLAQVSLAPDAPAIQAGDELVTFRDLDRHANQIAHRLLVDGVLPGMPVAVDLCRSIDLVATLLGIWKAGAYYVPLHDSHPRHRREETVRDSGARVVVTDRAAYDAVVPSGCRLVDAGLALDTLMPDTDPSIRSEPDALAFVLPPIGSTDIPAEVRVTHADVLDMASDCSSGDRWERFSPAAPVTSGVSVCELWVPLLNGGCCVLAPPETSTCR
jgi:non-ribosomal peptide synthetase component F